jgi:DNA-directed RNA polymerase specialized sigma24 family protein
MEMNEEELQEERTLLHELEKRNIRAFMRLYSHYGEDLLIFAYSRLEDRKLAVKMVDEFFEDLWTAARFTEITPPIYKYLIYQMQSICEKIKNT